MSENPLQLLTASRIVVVAGKGGVGKTTVTAVIASAACRMGQRVLAVELDGKPQLAAALADTPGVEVLSLSAADALEEYLRDNGFKRIAKRLNSTGVIDVVSTAAPGIDDIVVLGKIKQLERSGDYDLIVVDGPAAGHAVTFLMAAAGLADAVRGGPVRQQADDVLELLGDPERCQCVLVTLPETTPVNEAIDTAFALEDRVGVQLGPVVVNALDAAALRTDGIADPVQLVQALETAANEGKALENGAVLLDAARFRASRVTVQRNELARLRDELPLPCVTLPQRPSAGLSPADVTALADELLAASTPDDRSER